MSAEEPSEERITRRRGLPDGLRFPVMEEDGLTDAQAQRLMHAVLGTSPLEREILTHYATSPAEYRGNWVNWGLTVRSIIERYVGLGLLERIPAPDEGAATIKGNAAALKVYMDALSDVPLPVRKWVVPEL